jgi:hypothetical protein
VAKPGAASLGLHHTRQRSVTKPLKARRCMN